MRHKGKWEKLSGMGGMGKVHPAPTSPKLLWKGREYK